MLTVEKIKNAYSAGESDRENQIKSYIPLVKSIASKFSYKLPPSVDYDDLVSVGMMGLMEALSRYDETKKAKFQTYAVYRIRGSILNYLQSLSWVPRSVREKAKRMENTISLLNEKLGRMPSESEIMNEAGLTQEEYCKIMEEIVPVCIIPEDSLSDNDIPSSSAHHLNPENNLDRELKIKIVSEAVKSLPEKERLTVTLYFYEDLTLKEIAQIINVGESRVCQILSCAMSKIKTYLRGKV